MNLAISRNEGSVRRANAGRLRVLLSPAPGSELLAVWDRLVDAAPGSDVAQLSSWARFREGYGYQPLYLLVFESDTLLGGAQILHRRVPAIGELGYVPYGPVITGPDHIRPDVLDTTNSALAYIDLQNRPRVGNLGLKTFPIPQLVAPGQVADRPLLPSFLYLPGQHDLPAGAAALPWDPNASYVVGEFARNHGARVPGRLVSSAKSWLCHAGVDRTAPLLPWTAPPDDRLTGCGGSGWIITRSFAQA